MKYMESGLCISWVQLMPSSIQLPLAWGGPWPRIGYDEDENCLLYRIIEAKYDDAAPGIVRGITHRKFNEALVRAYVYTDPSFIYLHTYLAPSFLAPPLALEPLCTTNNLLLESVMIYCIDASTVVGYFVLSIMLDSSCGICT